MGFIILAIVIVTLIRKSEQCDCLNATCINAQIPPSGNALRSGGRWVISGKIEQVTYSPIHSKADVSVEEVGGNGEYDIDGADMALWKTYVLVGGTGYKVAIHAIDGPTYYNHRINHRGAPSYKCKAVPGPSTYTLNNCLGGIAMYSCSLGCEISINGCPQMCANSDGVAFTFGPSSTPGVGIYHPSASRDAPTSECLSTLGWTDGGALPYAASAISGDCDGASLMFMPQTPIIREPYIVLNSFSPPNLTKEGDIYTYNFPSGSNDFYDFIKCCGFLLGPGGAVAQYYANHDSRGGGNDKELNDRINKLIGDVNTNFGLVNAAIDDLRTKVTQLQVQVAENTAKIFLIEEFTNSTDWVDQHFIQIEEEILRKEGFCHQDGTLHCWCPPSAPPLPTQIPTNPPLPFDTNNIIQYVIIAAIIVAVIIAVFCMCKIGKTVGLCCV